MADVDAEQFWTIVDETRTRAHGHLDAQVEALHERLSGLDVGEVVEFDRQLVAANHALYSWRLWGAIDLMYGSQGDDGFTDARTWVITLGRTTYDEVLADPQALADVDVDVDATGDDLGIAEQWAGVPAAVYAGATGRDLWEDHPERASVELPEGEPDGTQLSDVPEDLAEIFPRLAERFG